MSQTGGFPDWGRYVQNVSDPLVVGAQNLPTLHTYFGPYFVGAYPVSTIRCTPGTSGDSCSYIFAFYADEALTELVGEVSYATINGIEIIDCIGNLGPWLQVEVTDGGFGPSEQATINVVASTGSVSDLRRAFFGNVIAVYNESIPGGDNVTFTGSYVVSGPAVLTVNTTAADWSAVMYGLVGGLRDMLLADVSNSTPAPFDPKYVALPAVPVEVVATNSDAGAQNFSVALIQAV
jgi:hypothetical protein